MRRKGQGALPAAVLMGVVLSTGPLSCSSSAQLSGAGGACVLSTDCQDGFICCNGDKGSYTCVASTSCLEPAGAGGMDAGASNMMMAQADGAGGDDMTTGNPPGTDASQQDMDTGMSTEPPDTGMVTKPPVDSGKPEDTGSPPQEAAPPPPDSGGEDATSE
jgi:hypothetical protein